MDGTAGPACPGDGRSVVAGGGVNAGSTVVMAWDASRPVPWERLMKEWVLYAAIMTGIFLLLFRDSNIVGAIAGVLISGPLYLILGAVLAKFGYTRKSMKQMRAERNDPQTQSESSSTSGDDSADTRRAPAPTRRTSGGSNRPTAKQKRR